MRIGIVGTGNMGRSLGILFAQAGHEVLFGARDPEKAGAAAALAGQGSRAGSNAEAAAFAPVVVYGVRDVPPAQVLGSPAALDGRIVVDMNNGEFPRRPRAVALGNSLAERLAAAAPGARVVKAFNTLAQEVFELAPEPLRGHAVSVFLAADDVEAKRVVAGLAEEIGFEAVDAGPLAAAQLLEDLADLVRHLIGPMGGGPLTTLSRRQLPPPATAPRLGGRQPSKLG